MLVFTTLPYKVSPGDWSSINTSFVVQDGHMVQEVHLFEAEAGETCSGVLP